MKDKWWRLTHLYKIKNKAGQLVTFKPNYVQLKHIAERGSHRFLKVLKARQFGITTLYEIDDLDESLWIPGMSSAIIAHRADKLEDYFEIVKLAYENMPPSLKPKTQTDTKYKYHFISAFNGMPLNSSIYVDTDVRGGTVLNLHITESAYIKDRQKLKTGSLQAVPKHGRISEETTGNGMNDFYDEYMEARSLQLAGKTTEMDYKTFFYAWIEHPEYTLEGDIPESEPYTNDELEVIKIAKQEYNIDVTPGQILWRRWKMRQLKSDQEGAGLSTIQLFKQEYPLTVHEAFQSGAGAVFDLAKLEAVRPKPIMTENEIREEFNALRGQDGRYDDAYLQKILDLKKIGVWFWHLPRFGVEYVTGVDPSDGKGADFGPVNIWTKYPHPETEKLQQCAQYYGKNLPDELANIAATLSTLYNTALLGIENNMLTTVLFASKIYSNIFYKVKFDEKVKKRTKIMGWNTNIQTREKMIDDFEIHFRDDLLEINSTITLKEMRTFIRKLMPSGAYKREHDDGKHDDSLFGDFIALQMALYRKPIARGFEDKADGF